MAYGLGDANEAAKNLIVVLRIKGSVVYRLVRQRRALGAFPRFNNQWDPEPDDIMSDG